MAEMIHHVDTKAIIVTLKMPRAFGLRVWLSLQAIKIAGWIAPYTIEVELKPE